MDLHLPSRFLKTHRISQLLLLLLLTSAFIFGGSSRYNEGLSIFLNTLSLLTLFYTLLWPKLPNCSPFSKWLVVTASLFIFFISLQLVMLPYDLWSKIPGRKILIESTNILELLNQQMPISFNAIETLKSLLAALPAIAVFCLLGKMRIKDSFPILVWTTCIVAVLSVLFGFIQLFQGRESFLYFHEITNRGNPVGFFANVNHQASFLVMCLPIFTVLAVKQHEKMIAHRSDIGQTVLIILIGIIILIGVTVAGSVAGYLLAPLMLGASLMVFLGQNKKINPVYFIGAVCVLGAAIYPILTSPQLSGLGQTSFDDGVGSRPYLFEKTITAIKDSFPFGTGLGSFESVFPLYESPNEVTETYMNHSHNEYLEWTLETGILFPVFFTIFLGFFFFQLIKIWREPASFNGLRRAASLIVFVPLLHSLVDYPTRTPAIAVFTAACLGIMFSESKKSERNSRKAKNASSHINL